MILAESRRGRRLNGRLGRGQELFGAVARMCAERGVRSGEVRAHGMLESCEIAEYDQAARAWKPGRKLGSVEVLSLTGSVSESSGQLALEAHATLMRDRDSGVEVVGGRLAKARVFSLEMVIECWDDVIVRRGVEGETGLSVWKEALVIGGGGESAETGTRTSTSPSTSTGTGTGTGTGTRGEDEDEDEHDDDGGDGNGKPAAPKLSAAWAEVARASAVHEDETPPERDVELRIGDVIEHPKFGRCSVERLEGDGEFAHVRLRNARLVRLSLEVLKLTLTVGGPPRVFRASVG